jgi:ribosomal protein S18 acetylase RimI-like enzyme
MENNVLNKYIILKKYIDEKDYAEIYKLEELCTIHDKVNLKLELDYRLLVHKDYQKSINDINEYLCYINGDLVGYIGISSFGGNIGEINGMVHPEWRRNGIFTKLCELAVEESRRRHFAKILVLCDGKSDTAIEFIKSTGAVYDFSEYGMKRSGSEIVDLANAVVTLKRVTNADIEEINRQNAVFFGDAGSEPVSPEEEEKNNKTTYMVKLEDKIIGKIKVTRGQTSAFISGFGILPDFRSKGYGKEALKQVLSMLNKEGIYESTLDVVAGNNNALNLYKSCGFKEQSIMNYYEVR